MSRVRRTPRSWWRVALAGTVALLLGNAVVFFAFTLARLDRLRRTEEYAAELRKTAATERADFARLKRRAQVLEANARDTNRFFGQMMRSKTDALADDLAAIETALRDSRLRADRRTYSDQAVRGTPLTRFAMRLPLAGPRARLAVLLSGIERSPRFLVIDRIALHDEREAGQSAVDVELSTYYRGANATVPTAAVRAHATRRPSSPR